MAGVSIVIAAAVPVDHVSPAAEAHHEIEDGCEEK
jgi:hypothetical protein